jgi:hypothetical protein
MLAGWIAHALALMAWAYVAGVTLPGAGAPTAHHHHAGAGHDPPQPAPADHQHDRCPLCPLIAGGALAPPIFMLASATARPAPRPQHTAPAHPFARADLSIARPRGPPSAV